MTVSSTRRQAFAVALLALALVALLAMLIARAGPLHVADAPADAQVPCVSYAPFRRDGHTPFDPALVVTPTQIEDDLQRLATITRCVRTYGVDHGLDAVPAAAKKLGLAVWLGVWIGRDAQANTLALDRGAALARAYPGTVTLLIVGNEVLLRRELAPDAMGALLARARTQSPVPVAYADVWAFWRRHAPALLAHVDVVLAHVLPYWEDEPVSAAQAAAHVHDLTDQLRREFAPRPVLVGEYGWPAQGRQRGPARPGEAEQATVVRDLLTQPLPAVGAWPAWNLIEGFDQPWKRRLEGAMGGAWGAFDATGQRRIAWQGAARGDTWAPVAIAAALAGGIAAGVVAFVRNRRSRSAHDPSHARSSPAVEGLRVAIGTALVGALTALHVQHSLPWIRDAAEAVLHIVIALAWCAEALRRMGAPAAAGDATLTTFARGMRRAALVAAAWVGCVLVADGRYRPLLWPLLTAPALMALHDAVAGRAQRLDAKDALLAALLVVTAALLVWNEGFDNAQALLLSGTLATWGAAMGVMHQRAPVGSDTAGTAVPVDAPAPSSASTIAASNAAATPRPAV